MTYAIYLFCPEVGFHHETNCIHTVGYFSAMRDISKSMANIFSLISLPLDIYAHFVQLSILSGVGASFNTSATYIMKALRLYNIESNKKL